MIEVLKTREGYVKAYMEYKVVDISGKEDPLGSWLYVRKLWIHPKHRHNQLINRLIKKVKDSIPTVKRVYWLRDKYKNSQGVERKSWYDLDRIIRRAG